VCRGQGGEGVWPLGEGGKGRGVEGGGHMVRWWEGEEGGDLLEGAVLLGPWGLWGELLGLWL